VQHWYALNTKPNNERQVEAFLQGRGMEIYFPTIPVPHRAGRPGERAFFPNYLFARADIDVVGLWTLNYAPGMRRVVVCGDTPVRVDEKLIVQLRERLARAEVIDTYGQVLEQGDRVMITAGPLKDMDAVFDQRLSPTGRVRILIQLLNRWSKVELDADILRKVSRIPRRNLAISSS
jgi:transcription antitermination factor NusG